MVSLNKRSGGRGSVPPSESRGTEDLIKGGLLHMARNSCCAPDDIRRMTDVGMQRAKQVSQPLSRSKRLKRVKGRAGQVKER